jgi:pimeloyl-ACP methyl ester carboxylesterase
LFPADVALLEKVGPAIVLTHSQSGVFGFKIADARPDLVKAHVAVEPNGPPFYDVDFKGGEDWYKDSDNVARTWGVARLPLAFDPPAADASALRHEETSILPLHLRCHFEIREFKSTEKRSEERKALTKPLRRRHREIRRL